MFLRSKPKLSYCGLTVVLSNQSRFDRTSLLSATGGHLFNDYCLRPEFNVMQCDIRLADDKSPLLPNTKCLLLLGEYSMRIYLPQLHSNTLNEVRGSVYYHKDIPTVCSFFPQDAADIKAHEQSLNPLSKEFTEVGDYEDDEDEGDVKRHGKTKRQNYSFWLKKDVARCKTILKEGIPTATIQPRYITATNSKDIVEILTRTKNEYFYFDMETDIEENNMQCFSFKFGESRDVWNIPFLDFNYKPFYSNLHLIYRALSVACRDNIIVAHNGQQFDFFVLGYKYSIPVYRCYDTMISHHRCWPDIEKSLGHAVSHLTWEPFHKDEDSRGYLSRDQMMARLGYCGKDVWTMYLVHKGIEKHAATIPGLQHSIDTANSHIVPYLMTSLQGIKYNVKKQRETMLDNDRLMMQYIRIINMLVGESALEEIRSSIKGKAKSLPGSNTQCAKYFHDMLGYAVVARSQDTGKPSLGKKSMFKLRLQYDNPVISFILAYRILQKEYGTLNFLPFKDDNNKIINWREYELARNRKELTDTTKETIQQQMPLKSMEEVHSSPASR